MFAKGLPLVLAAIAVYFAISMVLFNKVYNTSREIIDELFHVPQGLQYCASNFSYWDPKITTLPGLYIISYIFVKPFLGCSVYALRFTNLAASCVNIYIFASLIKNHQRSLKYDLRIVLQAVSLGILPPLYFFSHLYYTDTLSLTFALIFIRVYVMKDKYFLLTTIGLISIIMRQTNVVWIALCLGNTILDLFMHSYIVMKNAGKAKKNQFISNSEYIYGIRDGMEALIFHVQTRFIWIVKYLTFDTIMKLAAMFSLLIGFLTFVLINGSIVVGDKSAHTASVHIPQLFYFTLFYGVFSIPYIMRNLKCVARKIFQYKVLAFIILCIFLIAVHFNTLVHPYLLADNRHYTFYIWNKFFGKYNFAKYLITPVYVVLIFSLLNNINSTTNFGFLLPYFVCLFAAVALQKMIEVRYFLIPYVLLKLRFYKPAMSTILTDLSINILLNYVTMNVFFTKEIIWDDFSDIQRLIW